MLGLLGSLIECYYAWQIGREYPVALSVAAIAYGLALGVFAYVLWRRERRPKRPIEITFDVEAVEALERCNVS